MKKFYLFLGLWVALFSLKAQNVADFENIQLDSASWWNGADGSGGFYSGGFYFPNDYSQDWESWSGFSVSNMEDTTTTGWENQYSAITAGGANGSQNYAVVYIIGTLTMKFENPRQVNGMYVTNATYPYLSMKNGDDFTKKFGGPDGTDPDYFKLVLTATDVNGNETEPLEFMLADFTFGDSEQDYILKNWDWLDLSPLGEITQLNFSLESSDTGDWGMNTPAYFCIDNFSGGTTVSARFLNQNKVKIFPNPVNDVFYAEIPDGIRKITLFDMSGRILMQQPVQSKNRIRISALSGMPAGIYLLNLQSEEGNVQAKIIKQKRDKR